MKLVWHIVAKDVRRILGPAALWWLFLVGSTVWYGTAGIPPDIDFSRWFDLVRTWTQVGLVVQWLFALLLVAVVVQEDPLVDDRAGWATRPISGVRLLGAKLVSTTLLFTVVPVVTHVPVWLALGFTAAAVAQAAFALIWGHLIATWFALMVAALTRSLAQFLLVALALTFAFGALSGVALSVGYETLEMAVRRERALNVRLLLAMTPIAVFAHQFLTRRTARSWAVMAGALSVVVLVGWSWQWLPSLPRTIEDRPDIPVEIGRVFGRVDAVMPSEEQRRHRVPSLEVRTGTNAKSGSIFLPMSGRGELVWPTGERVTLRVDGLQMLLESVVRAHAVATVLPDELAWQVQLRRISAAEAKFRAGTAQWNGALRIAEYRRAWMVDVPLQEGATVQAESNRVRVLAIHPPGGGPAMVAIEERDGWRDELLNAGRIVFGTRRSVIDCLALRTRAGEVHVLSTEEVGASAKSSIARAVLRIGLPARLTKGDLEGAILMKVRFRLVDEFERQLAAPALEVVADKSS